MEWFNKLRAHRVVRGWSLDDLTKRTGIPKTTLSHIERGMKDPTRSQMLMFCELYNAAPQHLFFDETDRLG